MAFSEKLYTLRRKSGLSQAQLAEQLDVSRQAISKWEAGQSIPESDKLISISNYFHVTVDYLMKDDVEEPEGSLPTTTNTTKEVDESRKKMKNIMGMMICCLGIVCLVLWGICTIFFPGTTDEIGAASTVQIDGNGIFLILCILAMVGGAIMLLKDGEK